MTNPRPLIANSLKRRFILALIIWFQPTNGSAQYFLNDADIGQLQHFATFYKQLFIDLDMEREPDKALFDSLFYTQHVSIPNDYYKGGTQTFRAPTEYFDDITKFFVVNIQNLQKVTIELQDPLEALYGKRDGYYYIWLRKHIHYYFRNKEQNNLTWTQLQLIRTPYGKFKIIAVNSSIQPPADSDNDHIPDTCDVCPNEGQGEIALSGCKVRKEVIFNPDKPSNNGQPTNKGTGPGSEPVNRRSFFEWLNDIFTSDNPTPPSSWVSFEPVVGGVLPFGAIAKKKLLNYSANNWVDSGGMANPGYTFGAALQLYPTRQISIGGGYQHFYLPFDDARLKLHIENFLARNNINYRSVSTISTAYRFHLFYAQLGLGTYRSAKEVFKIEGLIGKINTKLSANDLRVYINYAAGDDQVSTVSFQESPYLAYGIKGSYQTSFGGSGKVRLQVTGIYITGKSGVPSRQIEFTHLPGKINLAMPSLHLAGLTVGVHVTLWGTDDL